MPVIYSDYGINMPKGQNKTASIDTSTETSQTEKNEEIITLLRSKLALDSKTTTIRVRPGKGGRDFLLIETANLDQKIALEEKINASLYESLIRRNTLTSKPSDGATLYLMAEQVGTLINQQLCPGDDSPYHRFLHFQPVVFDIHGHKTKFLVQFLDTEKYDTDCDIKQMVHKLNDNLTKPVYKDSKSKLAPKTGLFMWSMGHGQPFLYTTNCEAYDKYREITLQTYAKYNFRVHVIEDTPYKGLFDKLSAALTPQSFHLKSQVGDISQKATVCELKFIASADGESYFAEISKTTPHWEKLLKQYVKNFEIYQKRYSHKPFAFHPEENHITLDNNSYATWNEIVSSEIFNRRNQVSIHLPFSPYTTPFGEKYRIHIPKDRRPHEVAYALNRHYQETDRDVFLVDLSANPLIFIKEQDYATWRTVKTPDIPLAQPIEIPKNQVEILQKLTALRYSPVINYNSEIIPDALDALKEETPIAILPLVERAFVTKTKLLNEIHKIQEDDNLDTQNKSKSRKIIITHITSEHLSHFSSDEMLYSAQRIEELVTNCSSMARHAQSIYSCDRESLYYLIRKFIYPLNQKASIHFDKNTILLGALKGEFDLFNIVITDEMSHHQKQALTKLLVQIFCVLGDLVFYQHYIHAFQASQVIIRQEDPVLELDTTPIATSAAMEEPLATQPVPRRVTRRNAQPEQALDRLLTARPDLLIGMAQTFVDRSTIPGADKGLFLKEGQQILKGQCIAIYTGTIVSYESIDKDSPQTHFVSMAGYLSKNADIILSDKAPEVEGNAYWVNHRQDNALCNVKFKRVYFQQLCIGVILVAKTDMEIPKGYRVELFANYGPNAAESIHHIPRLPKPHKQETALLPSKDTSSKPQKRKAVHGKSDKQDDQDEFMSKRRESPSGQAIPTKTQAPQPKPTFGHFFTEPPPIRSISTPKKQHRMGTD